MTNSQEHDHASKKGCFSAVLHRFLCSGGLPTHPSSDIEESPAAPNTTTTPAGVVARLMGIDSFPNSPKLTMQKSRSLGSLDLLSNFHITKQPSPLHHRRVTSSLSFREVFLHDLAKSHMPFTPIQENSTNFKQPEGVVNTNKTMNKKKNKNTIKKRPSNVKMVKNGEEQVPLKISRKRRVLNGAKKKLVDDVFQDDHNKYKSRSKTYNHPLPKMGRKLEKKKTTSSMLKRRESKDYCIQVLKEVCKLTMLEIEGAAWVDTKVVDCYNIQQLSYEIARQILQLLLYEMVDDLIM